jgi:ABC-type histidine transport system ATPase subunit
MVSKSFGDNLVLGSFSKDVKLGEVIGIIGPSGSEKSTFLRCVNYLENPIMARLQLMEKKPLKMMRDSSKVSPTKRNPNNSLNKWT